MQNILTRISIFLLLILGISIISADILQNKKFIKNKILAENYLVLPNLGINNLFVKVSSIKYIFSSYFHDIHNTNNLLEENKKLQLELAVVKNQVSVAEFIKTKFSQNYYDKFDFIPIEIISRDKNYGMIFTPNNKISQGDLMISNCGIVGKVSFIGNQITVISLPQNQKLTIPFLIKNTKNSGILSLHNNQILDIQKPQDLKIGDELVTFEKKNKIPNGIYVGTISKIENSIAEITSQRCENQGFGFLMIKK